jgi:carbonic anhydrase/acetyltransferase-like protein (isoleucine patch superfamily)
VLSTLNHRVRVMNSELICFSTASASAPIQNVSPEHLGVNDPRYTQSRSFKMASSTSVPFTTSEARPRVQPPAAASTSALSTSKPPTEPHPTAHLDPQAYVQGTHTITLGENVVIHPRARLVSQYGPLVIGAGTIISERCVVGGPVPDPKEPLPSPAVESIRTVIGENVMLHAAVEVHAGAALDDACMIEPRVVVKKGVKVGKHSKVCAGCVVDRSVGDWVVMWGDGQTRRTRTGAVEPEDGRLRALERERDGTARLLKSAAAKATLGKRRG